MERSIKDTRKLKLAKVLLWQDYKDEAVVWDHLGDETQAEYLQRADEFIELLAKDDIFVVLINHD